MWYSLPTAVLLLGGLASAAGAQPPPAALGALGTDSTAWQRVLVHVVSALSSHLVQAAADPAAQPWRIELPADEPQRALLEPQLRRIVRARPPADADSVVYALSLGPLRIVGDTARMQFRLSFTQQCVGSAQTTGWGNEEEILVPRAPAGFWRAA
jgi:hypothetical protein